MATVPTSKRNVYSSGFVRINTNPPESEALGRYASRTHGTRTALGWREVVEVYDEKEKVTGNIRGVVKYLELSDYNIESRKGTSRTRVSKEQVFNISPQISPNWQLFVHVCSSIVITIPKSVPYPWRNPTHPLNEADDIGLFVNAELSPTLHRVFLDPSFSQVHHLQ
ncbi:hypothetical protein GYMLUDRAFT_251392 [Collybiopsis luxurians FD-317 M1]|uniref:Uncharacterized protein n=1 Tax=Collybiopsis luxurians FD-317 M1 TaxID=944289 RepID=A0A0D0APP0_9AGAR|nr:hypothetical protein GYMLUDRAFT_251392 [Collybiopsis luxurians FD-317 M1]